MKAVGPRGRLARLRARKGQALVEYALILAIVVLVVIVALTHVGTPVNNMITNASEMFPSTLS